MLKALLEAYEKKQKVTYPKCLFIPSDKILRLFMKALAKFGNEDSVDVFLLRFGLIDPNQVIGHLKNGVS
jgi:hypothetical protein